MRILASIVLAAMLTGVGPAANLPAAEPNGVTGSAVAIPLKDELEKGLKARRPEEFAFIGRVVDLVNKGRLPRDLVRSTFGWARKKRPYPYPYFERAEDSRRQDRHQSELKCEPHGMARARAARDGSGASRAVVRILI